MQRLNKLLFFIFLLSHVLIFAEKCHFTPPEKWDFAPVNKDSQYVKAAFIGKAQGPFRPSITLSEEDEINLSSEKYLSLVKEIYKEEEKDEVRDLGIIETQSGKANLLEITTKKEIGKIRTLQMIFMKDDQKAYILTASTLSTDLVTPEFIINSFKSFKIINSHTELVSNSSRRAKLNKLISQIPHNKRISQKKLEKTLIKLAKKMQKEFPELGSYSTLEILKESLIK